MLGPGGSYKKHECKERKAVLSWIIVELKSAVNPCLKNVNLDQKYKRAELLFRIYNYFPNNFGASGSSDGKGSDPRSRGPGFKTGAGHLVGGLDPT